MLVCLSVALATAPAHARPELPQELVATSAFGKLVLTTDHSQAACDARRHWKRVQSFLSELSSETADCIDAYNASELKRIGQSLSCVGAWRRAL